MKLWIEHCNDDSNFLGGKALFCRRLANELRRRGHDVLSGYDEPVDVSINVIRIKRRNAKLKLLRIDGVWHDTAKDWRAKNEAISRSCREADAIVYQSEFARNMGTRYLDEKDKPNRVIFNGSDPQIYADVSQANFNGKKAFLAMSKWRPHKRLREIILSFKEAQIPDSHLFVLGDGSRSGIPKEEAERYFAEPDIDYLGHLPQNLLMPILKAASASVHLCWFDACPNSVVEAICAGVPVVCNNTGGTREIVGLSGGLVLNLDREYDYEPVDLYHPPQINRRVVAAALRRCAYDPPKITNGHVDIRNVAKQYLDFIGELM